MPLVQQKQYAGGSSAVNPEHVAYVSPSFTDVHPYYSTIQTANAAASTNTIHLIEVFEGAYVVDNLALAAHLHCNEGVVIMSTSSNPIIKLSGSFRVSGYGRFQNSGTGPVFKVNGCAIPYLLTFNYALTTAGAYTIVINLMSTSWPITIDANVCGVIKNESYQQETELLPWTTIHVHELWGYESPKVDKIGFVRRAVIDCSLMERGVWMFQDGETVIDFKLHHSSINVITVLGDAKLTLRHGLITREDSGPAIVITNSTVTDLDNRIAQCVLEQVSMACYDQCVELNGTSSDIHATLITKNCTYYNTITGMASYSIVGNNAQWCYVYGEGGGNCATYPTDGVQEMIQSIVVDGAIFV